MAVRETECKGMDWVHLALDMNQWRVLMEIAVTKVP
jgi:hypothetical protein